MDYLSHHISSTKQFLLIMLFVLFSHEQDKTNSTFSNFNNPHLQKLTMGNLRFASMHPIHPDESKKRLHEIAEGQHPFAIVICCSDSRVPPELVFDQGLGDLFVIRTAGNLIGGLELGSIEYAIEHLHVQLIVVLGHQNCGAIKAYVDKSDVPGHIHELLDSIKQEKEIKEVVRSKSINLLSDCIRANVQHGVHQLQTQSAIIQDKMHQNELEIVGGVYNLKNGAIQWLNR